MAYKARLRPKEYLLKASGIWKGSVGISVIEVYERMGKSVILVGKKKNYTKKGRQMHSVAVKKSRNFLV